MTIADFFQDYGFSLVFSDPLWFDTSGSYVIQPDVLSSWAHEIATVGGYKSSSFTLNSVQWQIEDWIENGLGRHVEAYSSGGVLIWEGFVDSIEARIGTLSIKRGPLIDVANRVLVEYTPYVDITVDPPVTGNATESTLANDTDSQALFGIQEDVVSGGTLIDAATVGGGGTTEQNEIRDAYIADHKYPEVSESISFGSSQIPQLTINCLGYYEWLDRYVYTAAFSATVQIPTKIESVLGGDPNSIFSTDYNHINDDAHLLLLTPDGAEGNRTAMTQIEEMISQGDANDNRTYFAVYDDQVFWFDSIADEIEYYHRIGDRDQEVTLPDGTVVLPWSVRPNKWVNFPDFLVGRDFHSTELRHDPTNMFVESVKYSAPWGLELNGAKISNIEQLLAKKGVGV
jgi:hypothetical protein